MAGNMKAAVAILGENNLIVQYPADCSLGDLVKIVDQELSDVLAKNQRISLLQYWSTDFDMYVNIRNPNSLPDKCKILVKTCAREPVNIDPIETKEPASADGTKPASADDTKPASADDTKPASAVTPQTDAVPDDQPPQVEESTDNGETPKYPACMSPPEVDTSKEVLETSNGGAAAHVDREKIWKGRETLNVYFMNPDVLDNWKSRGEPMNFNTVLAWARVWNVSIFSDAIPSLAWREKAEKADVRVKFSETGGNWSMVGRDAETVTDMSKPTMVLNLLGHSAELQESLVIHEFGHALGLEHEHQRSDFWDVVGKHIDMDTMKDDTFVNPRQENDGGQSFGKDWLKLEKKTMPMESVPEYDPDSIMHYSFKVKWIRDKAHRSAESIGSDTSLTTKEKKYLKGIVKRSQGGQLLKHPSKNDYKALVEAYGKKFIAPENFDTLVTRKEPSTVGGVTLKINVHLRHIINATWEARSKWKMIGRELGLTEGDIEAINTNYHNVEDKYEDVLKKWMHTGKAKTNQLIDALRSLTVSKDDIADEILGIDDEQKRKDLGL
ncbi:uncharacterized protein LOC135332881 isoform X2 [Halichondria panicea]|uniref:uncharacterized protein LOC135332881 isoform X2 n=1 Tax=Halichondria panicea TaxID=6063 RepID=UPI00312B666D